MRWAKINVVVEDSSTVAGIVEQSGHLAAHGRVDREIRAEHHNVVGLDVRVRVVLVFYLAVFIKEVLGITLIMNFLKLLTLVLI